MTTYQIDTAHSSVEFSIRHLVIAKVRGRFAQFSGTIELDASHIAKSSVRAEIVAESISTNDDKRDAHLRSADFFDVAQFPRLTFESKSITGPIGDLRVIGALTLHGVTRDVELAVEHLGETQDPWGNHRVAFSAHATVNRKDFGLQWNQALETGGVMVGDKVELSFEIQAVRAAA